jgi:hypothetical protein
MVGKCGRSFGLQNDDDGDGDDNDADKTFLCVMVRDFRSDVRVIDNKKNVYLSSLMMKVPDHVYVLG